MAHYPILHRWSSTPIVLVEAASFNRALEMAAQRQVMLRYANLQGVVAPGVVLEGADLRGADLSSAILPGARLQAADLRSAKLAGTFLQEALLRKADLREADLRRADLRAANLEGARLVGADFRGALFYGSRLNGAILDWRWSGIPLELLRQGRSAGEDERIVEINPLAADDPRPFAWLKAILAHGSKGDRALEVLSRHIRPGDNAPELLRILAADTLRSPVAGTGAQAHGDFPELGPLLQRSTASPMLWTSRRGDREMLTLHKFA
jgi:hypothetical protein